MASIYVRNLMREWCSDAAMTLPFYDTVNREIDPRDPMWSTLSFITALTSTVTYCGGIEERGMVDFIALGKPGIGDAGLLTAAEHDVALLLAQLDPERRLTLLRSSPPEDFLQGGSVPWYTVSMVIEYVYAQPAPDAALNNEGANHDGAIA